MSLPFQGIFHKFCSYEWVCRLLMTIIGVLACGFSVGFFQAANFGTDPFTAFATGIANLFHVSYGMLYPWLNLILLIAMFFYGRHYIGIATIINLVGIGFMADLSKSFLLQITPAPDLTTRILYLFIGMIILCLSASMYMTSDLGVSTYDVVAISLAKLKTPLQFRFWRVLTDFLCVLIGFLLGATIGVGTIFTAFCMGPFLQFFNEKLWDPLLIRMRSADIHRQRNREKDFETDSKN